MAAQSPIKPSDLASISTGSLACDKLAELSATRTKMQTFLAWLLANDSSGNLGPDFLLALSQQFLFDAAKKGYLVGTDAATGYLALFQYLALAKLDPAGAADGDTLVFDGTDGVWKINSAPSSVYLAPTSGGVTVPAPSAGGTFSVAHGLSSTPLVCEAYLECNSNDGDYAVGDKVSAHDLIFFSGVAELEQASATYANASTVGVSFKNGSGSSKYKLIGKSSLSPDNIDPSKWNLKLYAAL